MDHCFHIIEYLAVIAGGVYGILLGRKHGMDFVGLYALAFVMAFGGGTLRDLFLDRHPLFWIRHEEYAIILFVLAFVASLFRTLPNIIVKLLHLPDALGLGLFSILGTSLALEAGTTWFIAALLGVVTGSFGGVMGQVICNEVPSLFTTKSPLYATCAFVGSWTYLLLLPICPTDTIPVVSGASVVVIMRLAAVYWDVRLPMRALVVHQDEPCEQTN